MPLFMIAIMVSSLFVFLAVQTQTVQPVYAAVGEGSATVGGGSNQDVEISSSTTFTIILTVGATGIATDADHPLFTIPTGFTAPEAAAESLIGDVNVDGEWFVDGDGGTCSVALVGATAASGQVITVDVDGACANPDTITLTYKGTAPATADAAADIDIKTDDAAAGGAATTLTGGVPTITVYGTSVFADHVIGAVASTDNLAGLHLIGGTDLVLGGFKITAAGEDANFTAIRIVVTPTTMAIGELTNLRIVEDDGTGGGVADNGTMEAGELASPLATVASPSSGNNDVSVSDVVGSGTTENFFIVGTIAATVEHGDTLDVDADGTAGTAVSGMDSGVAITSTGTSANSTRTVTDTTAPSFVSAVTLDNNNDGTVDYIKITYDEAIDDSTVAAGDYAAGIADTTAGNLTESFTSTEPSTGNETDSADDEYIYIGVTSSGETISTNKTDYTLKIEQIGGVDDANGVTLASVGSQTSANS